MVKLQSPFAYSMHMVNQIQTLKTNHQKKKKRIACNFLTYVNLIAFQR